MISIVIPLYNKEKFIAQTLQSVLQQTYKNFEVIVVDDGSTDGSAAVVQSINDDRIKLISIKNTGVSVARNTAIKQATYPWIAFLDADDWWDETFLEEINKAITAYPKNTIFATGRSLLFKDKTQRYSHPLLPEDGKTKAINYYQVISKYLPLINSSNSVIHASLFKKHGLFNPGQIKHEDHDLWMRLCVHQEVIFINKPLSFYRKTEANSASKQVYSASDFIVFINTISRVYNQLNSSDRPYFKQYFNRFLLLTFIKNYSHYTQTEDQQVYSKINTLLTGKYALLLRFLKVLPYKKTYSFLKFFKK